jgi:periplasmic copper chaperone A
VSRALAATIALAATLALPAGAAAHVEFTTERAPAGSDARLTLEVPNERPEAATRKIDIRMPAGVTSVKARALRGWRLKVTESGRGVRRVTLTAPRGSELTGTKKGRFGLVVGLPGRPGTTIVLPVLQTYDDGDVVRWIGPEGTSEPAPRLRLTAAKAVPPPEQPSQPAQPATTPTDAAPDKESDGGGGGGVPIVVGIGAMLLAAGAGTALARRRNRRRMDGRG